MNNAEKTSAVLVVLAVVFLVLALKFATGFGAPAPMPARIPLVDTQFLDTATFRKSYAELIRTKADLSDFDCYACHTKGKPPTLRFDAQQNLIIPKEHEDIVMGHGQPWPEQQLLQLPRRAEPGAAANPRRARDQAGRKPAAVRQLPRTDLPRLGSRRPWAHRRLLGPQRRPDQTPDLRGLPRSAPSQNPAPQAGARAESAPPGAAEPEIRSRRPSESEVRSPKLLGRGHPSRCAREQPRAK